MAVLNFSEENYRDNLIFISKVIESEDNISELKVEEIDFEAV